MQEPHDTSVPDVNVEELIVGFISANKLGEDLIAWFQEQQAVLPPFGNVSIPFIILENPFYTF